MITALQNYKNNFILPKKIDYSKRILWVDVAKGIGIFLIVLGHIIKKSPNPEINQAIYSFHVPFFFILSGIVFHRKENIGFWKFLEEKVLRIWQLRRFVTAFFQQWLF